MKLKNWHCLEAAARYVGIEIDPQKPRESRLAVALRCDELGRIPEAIEAMTGKPLSEYGQNEIGALSCQRKCVTDAKLFYEGFDAVDK